MFLELSPYNPEPGPMEMVFQYLKGNRLANREFADAAAPDRIAPIMRREWATIPAPAHTIHNR